MIYNAYKVIVSFETSFSSNSLRKPLFFFSKDYKIYSIYLKTTRSVLVIRLKVICYFVFLSGLSPFNRDRNFFLSVAYKPTQNLSHSVFWILLLLLKERFYKIFLILLLNTLPPVKLILPAPMLLLKLSLNWVQSDLRKSDL